MTAEFIAGINGIVQNIFTTTIIAALKNKIKIDEKLAKLKNSFYSKMQAIDLQDDIDGWREKLAKYHEGYYKEKEASGVASSTLSRIKKGFLFLSQYDEHEVMYQAKLIADLLTKKIYERSAVVNYFRRMK